MAANTGVVPSENQDRSEARSNLNPGSKVERSLPRAAAKLQYHAFVVLRQRGEIANRQTTVRFNWLRSPIKRVAEGALKARSVCRWKPYRWPHWSAAASPLSVLEVSSEEDSPSDLQVLLMILVQQPPGSRMCGQAILATLLGKTLKQMCDYVGHEHGTYTFELVNMLRFHEWKCPDHLQRIKQGVIPPLSIVRRTLTRDRKIVGRHWVFLDEAGVFWDPEQTPCTWPATSYLPLIRP